jgi:hypothetical protein
MKPASRKPTGLPIATLILLLLVILGVAGFAAVIWFTVPRAGPSLANFQRLTAGMTRTQVEATLGPPDAVTEACEDEMGKCPLHLRWNGDVGRITVTFTQGDIVDDGWVDAPQGWICWQHPDSLLESICEWLGL